MLRSIACGLIGVTLSCAVVRAEEPISADQLLKLDGAEFQKAAEEASYSLYGDRSNYTTGQLIAIAEKLLPRVKAIGATNNHEEENPFPLYFTSACKKASDEQLDVLTDLYSQIDPGAFEKSETLPALMARWIEREIPAIAKMDRRVALPAAETKVDKRISDAPKDLVDGWEKYSGIMAAYDQAFPQPGEKIDSYANRKSFYEIISAALQGKTDRKTELLKYAWTGANCLNVTDEEDAKDIAMLAMLLRERRLDLAVGAALRVIGTDGSTSHPEVVAGPVVKLFQTLGIDWEGIIAGAVLNEVAGPGGVWNRTPLIDVLAAHGSDHAVVMLNELAHFAGKDWAGQFVSAFDSIIPRDPSAKRFDGEVEYGNGVNRGATQTLSKEVTDLSLHTVEELIAPDSPAEMTGEAIGIFSRTQQPSSVAVLRRLTLHPSGDITDRAAAVLAAMGEQAPAKNTTPVSFRIVINDEPIAPGTPIEWSVKQSDGNQNWESTQVETGGLVKLDHKYFGAAPPLAKVTFSGSYQKSNNEFTVDIQPPSDLSRVTTVQIEASPLQIVFQNKGGLNAPFGSPVLLWIQRHSDSGFGGLSVGLASWREVPAESSITIPNVQTGTYDVWIAVTGAEMWHQVVDVSPDGPPVEAALKPGSDVRFTVVGPSGDMPYWGRLIRDGNPVKERMPNDGNRFLGCGNYVLDLPASEEWEQRDRTRNIARGPDEVPFSGRRIIFAISKGSPPVIDLGQIRLEALEQRAR